MQSSFPTRHSAGFTLVELLIVIMIIPILIAGFIFVIFNTVDAMSKSKQQLALTSQVQDAAYIMERDVRLNRGFNTVISSSYSDPYGPNSSGAAWNFAGISSDSRVLILSVPAVTSPSLNGDRDPVYLNSSLMTPPPTNVYNCTDQLHYNPVLGTRVIYFVRNSTLYRRILTNTTSPTCNNEKQYQKQSCPPELRSTWNSICKAADEVIAKNVTQFSVDYYTDQDSAPISGQYSSSAPDALSDADSIGVTIKNERRIAGQPVNGIVQLRMTKANEANG